MEIVIPNHAQWTLTKASEKDLPAINVFCAECKTLGFMNNQDLKTIKWDWVQSVGSYFIVVDNQSNRIFSMAGYHPLAELGDHCWRILFRGAQLPGYALGAFSKNQLKTSVQFAHMLYYQICDILSKDADAKIYMSTNVIDNMDAPKSARLNRSTTPILSTQGLITLEIPDIELYYTRQNLWRININEYITQRNQIYLD
jgi:hypothetical protein